MSIIPRTPAAIRDLIIGSVFILLGVLAPGSVIEKGFEAHVSGLAIGVGIGWLLYSIINNKQTKGK